MGDMLEIQNPQPLMGSLSFTFPQNSSILSFFPIIQAKSYVFVIYSICSMWYKFCSPYITTSLIALTGYTRLESKHVLQLFTFPAVYWSDCLCVDCLDRTGQKHNWQNSGVGHSIFEGKEKIGENPISLFFLTLAFELESLSSLW